MPRTDIGSEQLVPLLLLVPVATVFVLFVFPGLWPIGTQPTATYGSDVEATHSTESETVTIRLNSGDRYDRPFTDALVVSRSKQLDGAAGVRIVGDGETSAHGVWAGQLPGTDQHGVFDLPVSAGHDTTVRVTADGTDSDGDGTAGIERGETLYVLFVGDLEPDRPWREQGTTVVETITEPLTSSDRSLRSSRPTGPCSAVVGDPVVSSKPVDVLAGRCVRDGRPSRIGTGSPATASSALTRS